jgi:hypothetical protein
MIAGQVDVTIDTNAPIGNYETLNLKNVDPSAERPFGRD